MEKIVFISGERTPFGAFGGSLKDLSAQHVETPSDEIHAQTEEQYAQAASMVQAAVRIGGERPEALPEVYRRITLADL